MAATRCPSATSSGSSRTPMTPLAPATKIRMAAQPSQAGAVTRGWRRSAAQATLVP